MLSFCYVFVTFLRQQSLTNWQHSLNYPNTTDNMAHVILALTN
jgi:hypothetical protein